MQWPTSAARSSLKSVEELGEEVGVERRRKGVGGELRAISGSGCVGRVDAVRARQCWQHPAPGFGAVAMAVQQYERRSLAPRQVVRLQIPDYDSPFLDGCAHLTQPLCARIARATGPQATSSDPGAGPPSARSSRPPPLHFIECGSPRHIRRGRTLPRRRWRKPSRFTSCSVSTRVCRRSRSSCVKDRALRSMFGVQHLDQRAPAMSCRARGGS